MISFNMYYVYFLHYQYLLQKIILFLYYECYNLCKCIVYDVHFGVCYNTHCTYKESDVSRIKSLLSIINLCDQ